jgi:hypothetical protein
MVALLAIFLWTIVGTAWIYKTVQNATHRWEISIFATVIIVWIPLLLLLIWQDVRKRQLP